MLVLSRAPPRHLLLGNLHVVVMDWRALARSRVFACELVQIQLHQVLYQVAHLLLVVFQFLAVYDVLVFEVLQEVLQVLDGLVVLVVLPH